MDERRASTLTRDTPRCKCGAVMVLRGESGLYRCPQARGFSSLEDPNHPVVPIEVADAQLAAILANERGCCE